MAAAVSRSEILCRTCSAPAERIDRVGAGLVAVCARCADRTVVRCPHPCGKPLSMKGECVCGKTWVVDGGRLVPPSAAKKEAPIEAPVDLPSELAPEPTLSS